MTKLSHYELKVNPSNIHFLRRLFEHLKCEDGMGISIPNSKEYIPGHKYKVVGFDSDGDIRVQSDEKVRTLTRRALMTATVYASLDMEEIIGELSKASDIMAKKMIDRFHERREFVVGDRVRFIHGMEPDDSPNETLYVADVIPTVAAKDFSSAQRDILLGYNHPCGKFVVFGTSSRILEKDE